MDHHNKCGAISEEILGNFLSGDLIESKHWKNIETYSAAMKTDGYVKFKGLFSKLANFMDQENPCFQKMMRPKSFQMPEVNSPRVMRVLNGQELASLSPAFFRSTSIMKLGGS